MKIKSEFTNRSGQLLDIVYKDLKALDEIDEKKVSAVGAVCFYGDKIVIVFAQNKNSWTLPGGGVEKGETVEEAVIREVKEETNMRVLHQKIIGVHEIFEPDSIKIQTRSFCIVEPYGDFLTDPDGDITEIRLIDPLDCKKYFDWGIIGDHVIKRGMEFKASIDL